MESSRPRRHLGLLAFAFDGRGRLLLDALVGRPDLGNAFVVCHNLIFSGKPLEVGDPPIWHRRRPSLHWEEAPWNTRIGAHAGGFEAAVEDALDARRWLGLEGGVELVDLLLVAPADPLDRVDLPEGTLIALKRLRRRYARKLGRIMLVVERTFETLGQAGVPGKISPLPFADENEGLDGDLFDPILLFDRVNLENLVFADDLEAAANTSAAIVQLTVGELAATLFERLQAERARLPAARYVALGLNEWRLLPKQVVTLTSKQLYRSLAGLITARGDERHVDDDVNESRPATTDFPPAEAGDSSEPEVKSGSTDGSGENDKPRGDSTDPKAPIGAGMPSKGDRPANASAVAEKTRTVGRLSEDRWIDEVSQAVTTMSTEEQERRIEELRHRGQESLERLASDYRWSIADLGRLLLARCQRVALVQRNAARELVAFMQRFAPWHARRRAGLGFEVTRPQYRERRVLKQDQVVLFIISVLFAIGMGIAALTTSPFLALGIASAACAAGAVFIASRGFHTQISEPLPPPPPPDDLEEQLRLLRARLATASNVLRWTEGAIARLEDSLGSLRAAGDGTGQEQNPFPLIPEITAALLAHRGLEAPGVLARFWTERGAESLRDLTGSGDGLPDRLREFTVECCKELGDVGWQELLEALARRESSKGSLNEALEELLSLPMWTKVLEQARDAAVPRIPVAGLSSFNVLGLPRTLPRVMRRILTERFPERAIKVEIDGEAVLVVRVTLGYEV